MFGLFSPYDARNLQHMFNYKNMPRKSDFEEDEDLNENENENSNLNENGNENKTTRIVNCNKILPYNFITCHKAQGRTIPKVLLILDDLFEITMLYTAITRARDDIKFIKFKHLPNKTDIEAFKIMRDVIYKLPNEKIKLKPKKMKKKNKIKIENIMNIDYRNVCMNDENSNSNTSLINSNTSLINSNTSLINSNTSLINSNTSLNENSIKINYSNVQF
jgi:hypothetical protein